MYSLELPVDHQKIKQIGQANETIFKETKKSVMRSYGKTMSDDMNFIGRYKSVFREKEIEFLNRILKR